MENLATKYCMVLLTRLHSRSRCRSCDVSGDALSDQHSRRHHLRVLTKRDGVEWCVWSFRGCTCQRHCSFCLSTDVIVRANVIWYEWGSGLTIFFSFSRTFSSRPTREKPCISLSVFVTK